MVGSQIDPATIAYMHIRSHALEGQLFRSVLEEAVRAHGVASLVIRERDLYAQAAAVLKASEVEVKQSVTGLGRELGDPGVPRKSWWPLRPGLYSPATS